MGKYKIQISYKTGNSFNDEDREECLELEWDIIDVAKENLQAIKDHYNLVYDKIENSYGAQKDNQEVCKEHANKWWFVDQKKKNHDGDMIYDTYYASNCMKLKTDDGNLMQMGCFWTGHFERLYGAKIIVDESDMEFKI